jgi:hypothetical protein
VSDPELVRPFAVLDIDGVLADVRHRLHHLEQHPKEWPAFFAGAPQDPVLDEGVRLARELAEDSEIIYLTGRPERYRGPTADWLQRNELPAGQLLMRGDDDFRPGRVTKTEFLIELSTARPVRLLIDDDPTVIAAASKAGFSVLHADWMGQAPKLIEAQERDGRT